jgi:hypothetical protein
LFEDIAPNRTGTAFRTGTESRTARLAGSSATSRSRHNENLFQGVVPQPYRHRISYPTTRRVERYNKPGHDQDTMKICLRGHRSSLASTSEPPASFRIQYLKQCLRLASETEALSYIQNCNRKHVSLQGFKKKKRRSGVIVSKCTQMRLENHVYICGV